MPPANILVPYRFSGFCMFGTSTSRQKHAIYIVGWFDLPHDWENWRHGFAWKVNCRRVSQDARDFFESWLKRQNWKSKSWSRNYCCSDLPLSNQFFSSATAVACVGCVFFFSGAWQSFCWFQPGCCHHPFAVGISHPHCWGERAFVHPVDASGQWLHAVQEAQVPYPNLRALPHSILCDMACPDLWQVHQTEKLSNSPL